MLVIGLCISASAAQIREPTEFELKAVLLYKFALFTEWPASSATPMNLCVYGQNPYGEGIEALTEKSIQNRPLQIQYPARIADTGNCDILYARSSDLSQVQSLIAQIGDRPILTITDVPGENHHVGIINLTMGEKKIQFDIDLPAARRAGLSLSSKLLRLARQVHQ